MQKNDLSPIHLRFCSIFNSLGMTQKDFGIKLGLSHNQVSTILSGKSKVTASTIQLLWHNFKVNPEWLLHGELPMFIANDDLKTPGIPLLANIPAGPWMYWKDSYAAGAGDEYIYCPDIKGNNLFAVRVEGDSMEPLLFNKNILVIDPHKKFIKGIAVVRHHWGYKIRNVKKRGNTYLLMPANLKYDEEEITPDNDTHFYVPIRKITIGDI